MHAGVDEEDIDQLRRGEGGYNRGAETDGGLGAPGDEANTGGLEGGSGGWWQGWKRGLRSWRVN